MEKIETEYGYKKVYANGDTYHYNHQDELHNPNGPAVEYASGYKKYFINGLPHRTDGPAYDYADGDKLYYKHGKLHRTDGPAVIFEGLKLHFVNGRYVWQK